MNCIIIGGFLGSGKTTYVNYLMKHFGDLYPEQKMALLINEFGEIPVDAAMMDSGNYSLREITGGCICCTLKGMLADAVTELKERENPDLLIIEATGLAVPSEIAVSVGPAGGCSVFTQLCVDADQYSKLAGRLAIYDRQLADADTVLLTKKDIRGSKLLIEVETELAGLNEMRLCFSSNDIAAETIFSSFKKTPYIHENDAARHIDLHHHHEKHELKQDICQHTHRFSEMVELSTLEEVLTQMASAAGPDLFRVKGIVNTTKGRKAVQFADGELIAKDVSPSVEGESFIVFIGKNDVVEGVKNDLKRKCL